MKWALQLRKVAHAALGNAGERNYSLASFRSKGKHYTQQMSSLQDRNKLEVDANTRRDESYTVRKGILINAFWRGWRKTNVRKTQVFRSYSWLVIADMLRFSLGLLHRLSCTSFLAEMQRVFNCCKMQSFASSVDHSVQASSAAKRPVFSDAFGKSSVGMAGCVVTSENFVHCTNLTCYLWDNRALADCFKAADNLHRYYHY